MYVHARVSVLEQWTRGWMKIQVLMKMFGELPTLWECNRLMLFWLTYPLSFSISLCLSLPWSFSLSFFCHVTDLQFSGSSVKKWVAVIQFFFSSCEHSTNLCSEVEVLYECVCVADRTCSGHSLGRRRWPAALTGSPKPWAARLAGVLRPCHLRPCLCPTWWEHTHTHPSRDLPPLL